MTTHPTVYFARYADALPRLCVPSHLITARVKLNNCILHAPASHNGRVSLISCFQISCQWFTRCILTVTLLISCFLISCQWFTRCILTVTLLISCFQILCQVYQMYFQPSHCWFCVFKSCAWFTSCTLPVTLLISCFQILCMSHCWFHVFKTCAMFTRCILTVTLLILCFQILCHVYQMYLNHHNDKSGLWYSCVIKTLGPS